MTDREIRFESDDRTCRLVFDVQGGCVEVTVYCYAPEISRHFTFDTAECALLEGWLMAHLTSGALKFGDREGEET